MAARVERSDLWKSNARCLQLRLRDRFRVAVHRRLRSHPIFSDAYSPSSNLRRWIHQFRTDSLSSSSVFNRNRVSKNFSEEEESLIQRMLQAVAVPIIGNVCHVFMHGFNRIQVLGLEKFHDALLHRPKDKALITVSNHVASVDDPFVIAALLPPRVLLDARNLRWTLCATDRCFKNPVTSAFFRSVKVLPVSRGDGIYQKGMDMAISKLNQGGWVHIFPEGSRSRDGGKTLGSSKRGVGRLIIDADTIPIVVPFVHTGMQDIMPIGANLPRIGKTVTVLIGDPIYFEDLLKGEAVKGELTGNLYDAISSRIGCRLGELKAQVDQLAIRQASELQKLRKSTVDRASEIMQRFDWEPFGMGNFSLDDNEAPLSQETLIQPLEPDRSHSHHELSDKHFEVGVSYESQITSRMRNFMDKTELMRNFMDKTELMGFAARGLFMNRRAEKLRTSPREFCIGPLKIWKQFLEANVLGQRKYC